MAKLTEKAQPAVEQYGTPAQRARFFQVLVLSAWEQERHRPSVGTLGSARALLAASQDTHDAGFIGMSQFMLGFACLWRDELEEAEDALVLYQVWSLVRTLDEALLPGSGISLRSVHQQADQLILGVVEVLEGAVELEMVRALLTLRHALSSRRESQEKWQAEVEASRAAAINIVNNFFYEKLTAVPAIQVYMEQVQQR